MPEFVIPDQFNNADDYLRHITYLGAEKRYSDVNDDIRSRIDFELETIKNRDSPIIFNCLGFFGCC